MALIELCGKLQRTVFDICHIRVENLISWFVLLPLLLLGDALSVEVVKHGHNHHKHIDGPAEAGPTKAHPTSQ